jgi:hypothetical protein
MHASRLVSSLVALTLGLTLSGTAFADAPPATGSIVQGADGRRFVVVDGKLLALAEGPTSEKSDSDKVPTLQAKSTHGMVGSLSFSGALQLGSSGSESERACDSLGSQCTASPALGGGVFVSAGYQWKYLGFDLLGGGSFDAGGRRYVDPEGAAKSYHVQRLAGLTALRLRAQLQSESFRVALAAGPGVVWRLVGSVDRGVGVPDAPSSYSAIAFTGDVSGQWRLGESTALAIGAMAWLDHAGENVTANGAAARDGFRLVSGPQATLMPYLGLQFGP